jgi:hypothetical protein
MIKRRSLGSAALCLCLEVLPATAAVTVTIVTPGTLGNSVSLHAGDTFSVNIRVQVTDVAVSGVQMQLQASAANVLDVTGGTYNALIWDDGVMALPIEQTGLDTVGAGVIGTVPKAGTIQNATSVFATVELAVDPAAQAGTYTLNATAISCFDVSFNNIGGTAGPNFSVIVGGGGGGGGGVVDQDGDGVPDAQDACPGTPAGAAVDAVGCAASQRDSDSDGVTDDKDQCPGTQTGVTVDVNGCPVVPQQTDTDNDGVPDDADQCPGTAAGVTVDANGCPVAPQQTDTDNDGVPDNADQCPNTPAGVAVGSDGCPAQQPGPSPQVGLCGTGMVESLALSMTALLLVHRRRRHGMPT